MLSTLWPLRSGPSLFCLLVLGLEAYRRKRLFSSWISRHMLWPLGFACRSLRFWLTALTICSRSPRRIPGPSCFWSEQSHYQNRPPWLSFQDLPARWIIFFMTSAPSPWTFPAVSPVSAPSCSPCSRRFAPIYLCWTLIIKIIKMQEINAFE